MKTKEKLVSTYYVDTCTMFYAIGLHLTGILRMFPVVIDSSHICTYKLHFLNWTSFQLIGTFHDSSLLKLFSM